MFNIISKPLLTDISKYFSLISSRNFDNYTFGSRDEITPIAKNNYRTNNNSLLNQNKPKEFEYR